MSHPVPAVSHVRRSGRGLPARPAARPAAGTGGVGERRAGRRQRRRGGRAGGLGSPAGPEAARARLRELLCDGAERAAPCATSLEVEACFAPLLAWVLSWWAGDTLPLASDATSLRARVVVVSLSVLYRGSAIPVAWVVLRAQGQREVDPPPGTPAGAAGVRRAGGHAGAGDERPGLVASHAAGPYSGPGVASAAAHPPRRHLRSRRAAAASGARRGARCRLLLGRGGHRLQGHSQAARLHPGRRLGRRAERPLAAADRPAAGGIDGSWYGLRIWIELGFRALKSFGWDWQRTRRTKPLRIARHWLVLAIATLLNLAVGTRLEEAARRGVPPGRLRRPHRPPPARARRRSVFARGRDHLHGWCCVASAGGAPCGCCRSSCRPWPTMSPSSAMWRLQERIRVYLPLSEVEPGEGLVFP